MSDETPTRLTLSVGEHVRLPRTYRGRDVLWWMDASGTWDQRYDQVEDLTRARRLPSPQLAGTPERATLDLNALRMIIYAAILITMMVWRPEGILGERVGWSLGFGAAGFGMVIGLITYRLRGDKTLGDVGVRPGSIDPAEHRRVKLSTIIGVGVIALLVLLTMTGLIHVNAVSLAQKMTYVIVGSALLYFIYLFVAGGLTSEEKKRVVVIILLFFFAAIFWSAFEQAPTSLNLFARDFTNRVVFGWEMPTLWLQAANSVFVIALAPVFAAIWIALGKRGKAPSSIAKFGWGLFFAGVGFVVMVFAANIVIAGGGDVRVSPWWLVWSYFFQSVGELSLSPVGLSSMTKLAPIKFKGQMMGVWFMASALGNLVAGIVGGSVDPEKLPQMPILFRQTSLFLFIAAIVCGLLVIPVRRMMSDVPAANR